LAIVSIHQYRIKEDGIIGGGLMSDIKQVKKRNHIITSANANAANFTMPD
jgi:hypothetical protein